MEFDVVLKNARIVDPMNSIDMVGDLGIAGGKIAAIGPTAGSAKEIVDLAGKTCIPGVIDIHTHLGESYLGRSSFADLALEGVTTALDVSGPASTVMDNVGRFGCGMNLAILDAALPGKTLSSRRARKTEIEAFVEKSLAAGSYGVKILGGHYPFEPETTHDIISAANRARAHIAFHVGTTATASNITGLREAVAMSMDCQMQICHVQGYLRGAVLGDTLLEAKEAMELLQTTENIVTESTLCELANDHATCVDGLPASLVVRASLKLLGFAPTEKGLRDAIASGTVRVVISVDDRMIMLTGQDGLQEFERAGSNIMIMSPVNPRATGLICASAKDKNGRFVVDCLTADGGNAPREVQVRYGLALVRFAALTLGELVTKLSSNPARIMGLESKGHLGVGADADVTVLDLDRGIPCMGIVAGKTIMKDGKIYGEQGVIITTPAGTRAVEETGLSYTVNEPARGWMYTPRSKRF